jgi:hypothetical protein
MKTINVSDKDYELLMELSRELQAQENDHQAFPYFWSPRSTKDGIGTEDDTPMVYDNDAAETYTLEEYSKVNERLFRKFLNENELEEDSEVDEYECEWSIFIDNCRNHDLVIIYSRDEEVIDNNFSLFKSDVKNYIDNNKHHLGRNPHTYANTITRMDKMEKLIEIIYRLNPQKEKHVNPEARRYVFK